VSQFAVCTKEEIINMPDTLPFFLEKVITNVHLNFQLTKTLPTQVFGITTRAPIGAAVMIAFSAGGSVIALTFANARGKFARKPFFLSVLSLMMSSKARDCTNGIGAHSRVLVENFTSRDTCTCFVSTLDIQCYLHSDNTFK
jgi:hypothetical protein